MMYYSQQIQLGKSPVFVVGLWFDAGWIGLEMPQGSPGLGWLVDSLHSRHSRRPEAF